MSRRPRISQSHVIWAWADHIYDWRCDGLSVEAIRQKLRDQYSLRVGTEAIRAVLETPHGSSRQSCLVDGEARH